MEDPKDLGGTFMKKKKIGIVHTSFVFINVEPVIKDAFKELLPDVEVVDFVDSDVLATVQRDGCITPSSADRMLHLAEAAEAAGVDMIFSACSSLGPAMDRVREKVHVPVVKIDDAMAQLAVSKARRIGVLATVPSTLGPTVGLLEYWAAQVGKKVELHQKLCDGAFNILLSGDRERHDQMVLEGALSLKPDVDLIVLAQASMARLAPSLAEATGLEVLTSPRLAIQYVREQLEQMSDLAEVK
jgi:Asp/Glu/hydantoin racemase